MNATATALLSTSHKGIAGNRNLKNGQVSYGT